MSELTTVFNHRKAHEQLCSCAFSVGVVLTTGWVFFCGIRSCAGSDGRYRTEVILTERGGEMIKHADNSILCNEYVNDKDCVSFEKQSGSTGNSWEGLSDKDKKMTFREFLLHYNEEAFEMEMPDGTTALMIP